MRWQLARASPAQNTPTRHLKCSTNHLQCSFTSLHSLKFVCRISLILKCPNLHNIANHYHIQLSEASAATTGSAAQSTQTRHLKCSTNHLQCSCTSLHCLKCARRNGLTLRMQTPNGVHHNVANNYHILRSEALSASTGSAGSKYANEAFHLTCTFPLSTLFFPLRVHTHTHTRLRSKRPTLPCPTTLAFLISFI